MRECLASSLAMPLGAADIVSAIDDADVVRAVLRATSNASVLANAASLAPWPPAPLRPCLRKRPRRARRNLKAPPSS